MQTVVLVEMKLGIHGYPIGVLVGRGRILAACKAVGMPFIAVVVGDECFYY